MRELTIYFDFISPYAYLAWREVHDLAARHGRRVVAVPTLFAALLNHWGQKGPAEIAPKRIYTFKHVSRLATERGIRLTPPPSHPFNPLLALRVCSLELPDEVRRRIIDLFFEATWGGGEGVGDRERVVALLAGAGEDAEELVSRAEAQDAKDRLRRQTEAAIAQGVFGVPTMIADGELFWGFDSLPHVDRFLRGEDLFDQEGAARWASLPASASRI